MLTRWKRLWLMAGALNRFLCESSTDPIESNHMDRRRWDLGSGRHGTSCHRGESSRPCEDRQPEPIRANANLHTSQGLQSISISRLPPHVVWCLYLEYWHLDAN